MTLKEAISLISVISFFSKVGIQVYADEKLRHNFFETFFGKLYIYKFFIPMKKGRHSISDKLLQFANLALYLFYTGMVITFLWALLKK